LLVVFIQNTVIAPSDISDSEVEALANRYGRPKKLKFEADFLEPECDLIRGSTSKGRNHDITCFIRSDGGYVVIQKPAYSGTGIFRAPSGGAHPGETIEEGANREMHEETGLEVRLLRFVLDLSLKVHCGNETIPWRSLVFLADKAGGEMKPIDSHEISGITVMTKEQLLGPVTKLMKQSGMGGFKYRAFLTKSFFQEIRKLNL
jgi:ADP-ribose pyrophosphatase YjhB (NUDIX family)